MAGPTIDRANSSGDIWTPKPFLRAVEAKFGKLGVDLAASAESAAAGIYYTERDNSLRVPWHIHKELCWLNPPYGNIAVWAAKCVVEMAQGWQGLLLVPGSIGANWYWNYVEPVANVYSIGRLVFDNCFDRKTGELVRTPYAKDLILCHYDKFQAHQPMQRWPWKQTLAQLPPP